ncbi:MAG: hypothetical protein EB138_02040, partial [Actinobacteria bacterium]|nr:hypothetical protein [Actinomycetota bacterium]
MSAFPADTSLAALTRKTLVAPRMKVLYTPTTKVASTTIKWMLAEAEGTLDLTVIPRLMAAITNRSQTIHNRHVSGLAKLSDYSDREARAMLESADWLHVAALRDPVARAYSAWENRIFMRASGRVAGGFELTPDVLVDGRIDMTGSFAVFAKALAEHTDAFMLDHHFTPQSHVVRTDAVRYDLLVRVDQPGGVDSIAAQFRARSGTNVQPRRHNESMGVDHRPEMAERLAVMHVSQAQTIHHPRVHGLPRLADLSEPEQHEVLYSPDWLRVASVRDPISRAYSAWENRIFLRAHRRTTKLAELAHDVLTDGKVDLTASFANFAKVLGDDADPFMADHHFQPQSLLVRPDLVNYSLLVRVDQAGEIDSFARIVSERSGKQIVASRLNEGLGVKVERVCDAHTANRLMATYEMDYETFGFTRRSWPAIVEPYLLGDMESRLVTHYRSLFARSISVSRESQRRVGARYG